jgi:CheY-like chemotaxis protein
VAVKPGREVKALVVDDKATNRLILKEMLEGAGFIVLEAADGREAVDRALEWRPAVVFMDIKMPVLDGYGAVAELKATEAGRAMRIFALTASAFRHDEEKILASGFDGFLAKPFKMSALFRLVEEKAGLELVYEEASAAADAPPDAESLDWRALRDAVGPEELAALAEAVGINDFTTARTLAGRMEAKAPKLAALLRALAGAYDEAGLEKVVARLKGESDGS